MSADELADDIAALRSALVTAADPTRAPAMAAYMKDRFPFLGVPAPARRVAQRDFLEDRRNGGAGDALGAADACWAEPEREFQYVGVDLLRRRVGRLRSQDLGRVERLIRTRSWWDTVDLLATHVVGPMVAADDALQRTMDRWIADDDMWIARTAILHQLGYGARTDAERLFAYVDRRCDDQEFFIRKASGWALREYAKTAPDAVRGYVADRGDRLSGLTRREALKHLA